MTSPTLPSIADLEAAVRANPGDATLWTVLGGLLRKAGNHAAAIACHRRALDLSPGDGAIWTNLGNALTSADRLDEAAAAHDKAIALAPGQPLMLLNRIGTLRKAGRFAEALAALDDAVALSPADPDLRWERALTRLQVGDYVHGFAEYDARLRIASWRNRLAPGTPWDGSELNGRTLFLSTEQGFGDSLLVSRYLPLAAQRGGRIVMECHPELRRLYGALGVDAFVDRDAPLPDHDLQLPQLSLPRIFGTTAAFVPPPAPLTIPDTARAKAEQVLGPAVPGQMRVGIVWSGRTTFADNQRRATPLAPFLRFAEVPGVRLYSLQKGPPEEQLAVPGIAALVSDLAPHIDDFADTAALLERLDLVIMTDSSVAHLAGTLGRPIWNLVQHMPYWVYGVRGDGTPWYPSMRLFRQGPDQRWEPVFDQAAAALAQMAAERAAAAPEPVPAPSGALPPAPTAGPTEAGAIAQRAAELLAERRIDAAKPLVRAALRLDPALAPALTGQAAVMQAQGRLFDAQTWRRRSAVAAPGAAEPMPDQPLARFNRATALRKAGRFAEALAALDDAIARAPADPDLRWERALARLQVGDYVHGFAEYDARLRIASWRNRLAPGTPWDGSELNGRTLFLSTEQGFGDSLLVSRYLPLAAQRGGRIVMECHPELRRLYGALGVDAFIDRDAPLPDHDLQLPQLSLPRVFGTTAAFVPPPAPLTIPDTARAKAEQVLGPAVPGHLRVGIVWSGRTTFADNHLRATPLAPFLRFAEVPGVRLYSLQKGPPEEQLAAPGAARAVTDLAPHIDDFADTAALLERLDLVIMTDSSVAHLAGTLGRPIWNLVQHVPYWVYGVQGDGTPWYPSMRLFRQGPDQRWEPVFDQAAAALRQMAAERAAGAAAGSGAASAAPDAGALYREALRAGGEGRRGDERALLQQLVQVSPQHCDALARLAASLLCERRLDAARPLADAALRLDPAAGGALASQGAVMMLQGDGSVAETWFRRAAVIDPGQDSHRHNIDAARRMQLAQAGTA